jgi:hypothetical protein
MEKSSQIAWKVIPLRHFFPLKVVPLIEVLLYSKSGKVVTPSAPDVALVCNSACLSLRIPGIEKNRGISKLIFEEALFKVLPP